MLTFASYSQIVNLGVSREQAIQTLTAVGGNGKLCADESWFRVVSYLHHSLQWTWQHLFCFDRGEVGAFTIRHRTGFCRDVVAFSAEAEAIPSERL